MATHEEQFYMETHIWPNGKDRSGHLHHDTDQELFEVKARAYNLWRENKQQAAEIERHRWIPVSERLPDNGGSRLLAYGKDGYGYKIVAADSYDGKFEKFRILNDVTHWKYIVLPDKESEATNEAN